MPIDQITSASIENASIAQVDLATGVAGTGPAFSAYQSVAQTGISNTTPTKVTYNVEDYDTANCFSSSRFTPNVAGYYQISGAATVATTTATLGLIVVIYKNGNSFKSGSAARATSNMYPTSSVSSLVYFNGTTDYVEMYVYGDMGGTFSLLNSQNDTWFNGFLARAA
jgi:hypothetical protein